MTVNEILGYVLETPDNTNPSVLKDMLNELIEEVPTGYNITDAELMPVDFNCDVPAPDNELVLIDVIIGADADHLEFVSRINMSELITANKKVYYLAPEGQGNSNLIQHSIAYAVEGSGSLAPTFSGGEVTNIKVMTSTDSHTVLNIRPTSSTINELAVDVVWE